MTDCHYIYVLKVKYVCAHFKIYEFSGMPSSTLSQSLSLSPLQQGNIFDLTF